jgi:diguanylate cyclase (GGDEF)-like protein
VEVGLVHGLFISAESVVCLIAWRLNEIAIGGERAARLELLRERTPMALLFMDLDEFKGVNDALGHAAGDDLLVGFARRLESLIRPSDTPARFGGDEFAILLEDTDEASAIAVAERILTSLRTSFRVGDQEVLMQASIGIATMDEGSTSDLLLRDADIAMYAAKTEGKSRYRLGTPELRAAASDNLALRRELGRAVERGELVLRYQPIVDLRSERIVGLEALVVGITQREGWCRRWSSSRWRRRRVRSSSSERGCCGRRRSAFVFCTTSSA